MFAQFIEALLAELPKKNGWTLSERAGHVGADLMQWLLNGSAWRADSLRDAVREYVVEHLGDPDASLVIDDTRAQKKGTKSVGAAFQHCGLTGGVRNCQAMVMLTYAGGVHISSAAAARNPSTGSPRSPAQRTSRSTSNPHPASNSSAPASEGLRDTAADAARRLLIDPETDLLSRRVDTEEMSDAIVAEVRRAVFAGHRLRIHYAAVDQAPKWRTVDPIGLVTVREQGYLLAKRAGEDRTYRLSRVLAAEELDEPAQRPDTVDLDRAWQERNAQFRTGGDTVAVLVRVHPVRREHLVGTVLAVCAEEADVDGWLRLNVIFQDSRHAEWALWQHATDAEVLAPQWLRTSLRNRAAAIAARYGPPS
ncbi:WYL domain-containing protein [Streptomyces canus]|uniref:transposase n=1 Tax=Streptomyces canus TaxID=58343 RepID=UPI00386BDE97|nr:WYL domain-containing protein [Streptomyces canus]